LIFRGRKEERGWGGEGREWVLIIFF